MPRGKYFFPSTFSEIYRFCTVLASVILYSNVKVALIFDVDAAQPIYQLPRIANSSCCFSCSSCSITKNLVDQPPRSSGEEFPL